MILPPWKLKNYALLAIQIFKTINNVNPSFMKDIFTPKRDPKIRPHDILVKHHKSTKYADKSLISFRPENMESTSFQSKTLNIYH